MFCEEKKPFPRSPLPKGGIVGARVQNYDKISGDFAKHFEKYGLSAISKGIWGRGGQRCWGGGISDCWVGVVPTPPSDFEKPRVGGCPADPPPSEFEKVRVRGAVCFDRGPGQRSHRAVRARDTQGLLLR